MTDTTSIVITRIRSPASPADDELHDPICDNEETNVNHHHEDEDDDDTSQDSSDSYHQSHHPHKPPFGRPETRLTETQLEALSSLIMIIREGDYKEFLELLESKGSSSLLNVFVDGQTPLHYSLIYGRSLAWCKQLVSNGANPNLTNRAGWHPIHLAAFNGSRETMRYLIDIITN